MDVQRELFPARREPVPVDPHVEPADVPRLSRQCKAVLALFRERPVRTNRELAGVCLRYSARLHDLGKAGCRFESRNLGGGLWEFELTYCPEGLNSGT